MDMNDYENELAVEVTCRNCGIQFVASFYGPDSIYVECSLCPECFDEASDDELDRFRSWN